MNMGNTSFPKLQFVKPSGELIKEFTTGGKPYVTEFMVTPDMKSNNPNMRSPRSPLVRPIQTRGTTHPGENWQTDITVMPRALGTFRYLLVLEDLLSGWMEAFPTKV